MPATDQTWYPMKLLHRVFALASLALLAASIWLLVQDHRRPWKQYQRTANRIAGRMAAWRELEFDPNAGSRAAEPRYFHFERGFPLPDSKLLELPILDAFNSPLRIENLWAEGLTQDYHFREVPRFDRCTTCHTAMQKTEPGSADAPAYPREHLLQFTVTPNVVFDIRTRGVAPGWFVSVPSGRAVVADWNVRPQAIVRNAQRQNLRLVEVRQALRLELRRGWLQQELGQVFRRIGDGHHLARCVAMADGLQQQVRHDGCRQVPDRPPKKITQPRSA